MIVRTTDTAMIILDQVVQNPSLEPSRKQEERKTEKQLEKIGNQGSG